MPSRNTIKVYGEKCFYHIYNRGAHKDLVFREEEDYTVFLSLFKRHLSKQPTRDPVGRQYRHLVSYVSLLNYCLMPNHFHLLCFNRQSQGIELLLRSISTAYSMFYNRKYSHSGHIFQGVYKATLIDSETYLQHVSRYIHLNAKRYQTYPFSSYRNLISKWNTEWLDTKMFWQHFEGTIKDYENFVSDYHDYRKSLETIQSQLADT